MTPARTCVVLQIVTSASTDLQDYTYYFVPAPWLSVKLLRLLQCYPPPGNRRAAAAAASASQSRLLRGWGLWLLSAVFVSPLLALVLILWTLYDAASHLGFPRAAGTELTILLQIGIISAFYIVSDLCRFLKQCF